MIFFNININGKYTIKMWYETTTIVPEKYNKTLNDMNKEIFQNCRRKTIEEIAIIYNDESKISNDTISKVKFLLGFEPSREVKLALTSNNGIWAQGEMNFDVLSPSGLKIMSDCTYNLKYDGNKWLLSVCGYSYI